MSTRERRSWTAHEDQLLRQAVEKEDPGTSNPSKWHAIAKHVPSRTNKDCRKRWFAKMVSDVVKGGWAPDEDERLVNAIELHSTRWSLVASVVQTRNSDQCAKRWTDTLNPNIDRRSWTAESDAILVKAVNDHGKVWTKIVKTYFPGRTGLSAKNRYNSITRSSSSGSEHRHPRHPHRKSMSSASSSSSSSASSSSSSPTTPSPTSSDFLSLPHSEFPSPPCSSYESSRWPSPFAEERSLTGSPVFTMPTPDGTGNGYVQPELTVSELYYSNSKAPMTAFEDETVGLSYPFDSYAQQSSQHTVSVSDIASLFPSSAVAQLYPNGTNANTAASYSPREPETASVAAAAPASSDATHSTLLDVPDQWIAAMTSCDPRHWDKWKAYPVSSGLPQQF